MVRALAVHREQRVLGDLPVIEQVNALGHVQDIDFLRQLSASVPTEKLMNDKPAFDRAVADFTKRELESLDDRRQWVEFADAGAKSRAGGSVSGVRRLAAKPAGEGSFAATGGTRSTALTMRPNCRRRWSRTANGCRGTRPASRNRCARMLEKLSARRAGGLRFGEWCNAEEEQAARQSACRGCSKAAERTSVTGE